MAFVAEDGTGLSNANSLTSVAYADAYFLDRGVLAWQGPTTVKEQALVRATDYLSEPGRYRWKGLKKVETQALPWPRTGIFVGPECAPVDEDSVPDEVQKSACELALVSLTDDLEPNSLNRDSDAQVTAESKRAGNLAVSTTRRQRGTNQPVFHKVLNFLRDLVGARALLRS